MNASIKLSILLFNGICWGATLPLTKIAVSSGHQPMGLIFWQLAISLLVLTPVVVIRRKWPADLRRSLVFFLVIGLTGTVIPDSVFYLVAARLPAGLLSIIITSVPLFTIAMAIMLKVEGVSATRIAGILLGAVAMLLLAGAQDSFTGAARPVFVLIALAAPFFYAFQGNYITLKAPQDFDPIVTLWGASLAGLIMAAPLVYFTGDWVDLTSPWSAPEWALLGATLLHVLAYAINIWLITKAGPVFTSQTAYIVAIAGVLLSALILGETYSAWVWAALALLLAGLAVVQPRKVSNAVAAERL